jgi:hypothetical protein
MNMFYISGTTRPTSLPREAAVADYFMIGEEIGWVFRRELQSVNSEDGMVG